ncbi:thiol reductant ABC exporter subunit CydC [Oceanobacillus halophilus]|uniref:Thiol reductant ABC exporter subunit CydC n=1 Tax=Oceanobacillus halophilus TaxID=930130 RepID=A0A495A149_9BACI|nr:thiol reductant ABC exporter subunit CydC [Oceanobacillus halophilus]RKQ33161.1 thiol reductant ABC exporter subunit CydC [Oceanobacillus halophilus]
MKLYQKFINPYMKKYYKSLTIAIFFAVLTMASSAMLTFTSGYLISKASLRPETILLLYIPIVGVRTFGISRAVFQYFERLTGHNAVLKILSKMRVQLYQMIEPQALFIHHRFKTGDLLGTLADDIEHLQDVYIRTIFPSISALVIFFVSISTLSVFDWKFAIFMSFCVGIIVFIYPLWSLFLLKRRQLEQKKWRTLLYENLTDAFFGLRDWMISRKKQTFIDKFLNDSQQNNNIDRKISYWNQSRTLQLQVLSGVILVIMAIWSSNMAQSGELAPAYIAAFTLVTLPVLEGLIPISHAVERIPTYEESLKRLDNIDKQTSDSFSSQRNKTIISNTAHINLHRVFFSYEGQDDNAIKDFNLTIPQGQKLAVLGKSGAGKTTFMQLLQGALSPVSGNITINGYSPKEYGEDIYEMLSVLNQKPYLFASTVENNIRLGNESATREEIEAVMKKVKLDEYIHSLPAGLDTQMEETGQRFSGGERQRIALARILLKDTPIVILDEPTIGLDPITESSLLATIFESLHDKTIIWITHHLIDIEKMDEILFMDNGEITMSGSHYSLMIRSERYRDLYRLDRGIME